MKKPIIYIMSALLLTACSTTKYVPEGDQLYTGIKKLEFIEPELYAATPTGETAMEEVTYALSCAPNGSIAGSSSLRGLPIGVEAQKSPLCRFPGLESGQLTME